MRKILLLITFISVFFLKDVHVIQAQQCDQSQYNKNAVHYVSDPDECTAINGCVAGLGRGAVGGYACWPPGPTESAADCPTGYLRSGDQCCKQVKGSPVCNLGSVPLTECDSGEKYNSDTGMCEQQTSTVAISPQTCDFTSNPMIDGGVDPRRDIKTPGIETALGCIPTDPQGLLGWLFTFGLSIGGGLAFILMGVGSFFLITAKGVPEQIQKGKDIIWAAVAGLLFIIFSVWLLQMIGFSILSIPGFKYL